jgi:hypothetical protein
MPAKGIMALKSHTASENRTAAPALDCPALDCPALDCLQSMCSGAVEHVMSDEAEATPLKTGML